MEKNRLKTRTLCAIFILFFTLLVNNGYSQGTNNVFEHTNNMLREMLKDLLIPPQKLDYLCEMAAHTIDSSQNSVFYNVSPESNHILNYQVFDFSGRLHAEGIAQKIDENKVKVPAVHGNKMVLIRLHNQEVNETFEIYQP